MLHVSYTHNALQIRPLQVCKYVEVVAALKSLIAIWGNIAAVSPEMTCDHSIFGSYEAHEFGVRPSPVSYGPRL